MRIDDADLLDEFLEEQPGYSADFKALVLRLVSQHAGDIKVVSFQTGVSESTIYNWVQLWNHRHRLNKKKF